MRNKNEKERGEKVERRISKIMKEKHRGRKKERY